MALSGLEIQKILPRTNCKECGSSTCLAFAMKLAAKKANLAECPYASDEAKTILGADSEPPVRAVKIGQWKIGEETVLYRHEKTFVNQTLIGINIDDDEKDVSRVLEGISNYRLERVGDVLTVNCVATRQKTLDSAKFAQLTACANERTGLPVLIRASDVPSARAASQAVKNTGSVICDVNRENVEEMIEIARESSLNLALTMPGLDDTAELVTLVQGRGFQNILIQSAATSLAEQIQINTITRRSAIKDRYKPLGYAGLKFIESGDVFEATAQAVIEIEKYGGIVILPKFNPAQLAALMTLRQNIFTDPQKPIQVEPRIYAIGEPDRHSDVFVTTNFSLTYFIVSGEIENSGISAHLVVPECEGMSVQTAWAAGKFSGAHIAQAAREMGLENMVDTRRIVIPGYVSQISGELEENLPGWKVLVGPQEAADLEGFVKGVLQART